MKEQEEKSTKDKDIPALLSIDVIAKDFLRGCNKRRIRTLCTTYCRTIKISGRIYVDGPQFVALINDPDRDHIL